MAKEVSKERLLALLKIMFENTDDEQGLTLEQIIEELELAGVSAERKAIYRDFEALNNAGVEIQRQHAKPVRYFLAKRPFTKSELLLLIDAVQGSRFITARQSTSLVRSIKSLGSKHQNDSVFRNVDVIQEAIAAKRMLSFKYTGYDCSARVQLRHGGQPYTQTPVQLMYSDGFYYLVCYSEKYDDFANYRVDRMCDIHVTQQRATRNARIATFDADEYDRRVFGMFSGSSVRAVLRVRESAMNAVIDRFGKDARVSDMGDGTARVSVAAMATPVFFGWIAQFAGQITVESPSSLRQGYAGYLHELLQDYE